MNTVGNSKPVDWAPSVYFAESFIRCELDRAWRILLDYERWNPTFAGAQVTAIKGAARSEGEVVLISKKLSDPKSEPLPEFYCETVKVVPGRRIVWYLYAKEGHAYRSQRDPFRNFVDFGLTEESGGVKFNICYYAQNRLSGESLSTERGFMQPLLQDIAGAFRDYCEAGQ